MASASAMLSSVSATASCANLFSPLPSRSLSRSIGASRVAPIQLRRSILCQASNEDPLSAVKSSVDGTKVSITKDSVLANQEGNASEKQSVVGTTPARGSTIPRAEVDRRPELGNTSFGSIMAFDGPGPETINGRLAMLGCAWGFISEIMTGQRIVDQVNSPNSPGLYWLLASTQLLIFASLVPIFNGESPDSRRNGPFTGKAERWNGRLAMVGFAGILIWEYIFGRALFHF